MATFFQFTSSTKSDQTGQKDIPAFLVEMKGKPAEQKHVTTWILDLSNDDIVHLEVRDEAGTIVLTEDEGKP